MHHRIEMNTPLLSFSDSDPMTGLFSRFPDSPAQSHLSNKPFTLLTVFTGFSFRVTTAAPAVAHCFCSLAQFWLNNDTV